MKKWTIMIYMAGDNNLSVDMAYAMQQIKGVAGTGDDSPNVFVYYDGYSPAIPTLYCDFSDPEKPTYAPSFSIEDKLYPMPAKVNENAADKRSVVNFVDWCVNKVEYTDENGNVANGRRAEKYAVIFSGHSLGFQDIGLFKDETSGKSMKMNDFFILLDRLVRTEAELAHYIEGADVDSDFYKQETKELLAQPIDLLGFDACVMGMMEVGYQFATVAKTMIASEGSVPSAGWTYAKILGSLACAHTDDYTPNSFAERFVREFIKSQEDFTVGGVSVDMAAWDLSQLTDLANTFDAVAITLLDCFIDPESRIYRQMERVILQVHYKCQSYMYDQNVDLGDFCELLDKECGNLLKELGEAEDTAILAEIQTRCRTALDQLNKAVILSGFVGGDYQYSNGISVFFPWSADGYAVSQKNYEGLFFVKDTGRSKQFSWTGFLKKYLFEVSMREFEPPVDPVPVGTKYRYYSGIPLSDLFLAGSAEETDVKMPGQQSSKMPGQQSSKMPGQQSSKMPGQQSSKMPGQQSSKMPGQQSSKMPGQQSSKMPGQQSSKMPGQQSSKMPGQQSSKMPGQQSSKMPGQQSSKMAGGSGGSDHFFDSLRLFKNIESRWDIAGFTKKIDD